MWDEDAVSPVIGVILMVAITVILAAVIGSFVLGLGNQTEDGTPTASFDFEFERVDENPDGEDWGMVTITHTGGESINDENLYIRGTGFNSSGRCSGGFGLAKDWASTPNTYGNRCNVRTSMNDLTDEEIHRSMPGKWPAKQTSGEDTRIASGDFARVYTTTDYELELIYQTPDSSKTATIVENEGPDA